MFVFYLILIKNIKHSKIIFYFFLKNVYEIYPGNEDQWLKLALSKGPNTVGAYLHSPEDGEKYSFRNVESSSDLNFRTIDNAHRPSNSEYTMLYFRK
jgi:hypothetical protein